MLAVAELKSLRCQVEHMTAEEMLISCRRIIESHLEANSLLSSRSRSDQEITKFYRELKEQCSLIEKENKELREKLGNVAAQLSLRKEDLYGRSTEKTADILKGAKFDAEPKDPTDENASEDNEGEVQDDEPARSIKKRARSTPRTSRPRSRDNSNLPVKADIIYDPDELDARYGRFNWRVFAWTKYEEIEAVPSQTFLKVTYVPVVSVGLEHEMVRYPYTSRLKPGSKVSSSLLAEIIYNKFVMGLPLYRQELSYVRNGACILRQTMGKWIDEFTTSLLRAVYDHLQQLLRLSKYHQNDETYVQVINDGRKAGSKSYMWVHTTSELLDGNPITVFCYEKTRGTDHLRDFYLNGKKPFAGNVSCDAYVSYSILEKEAEGKISVSGCFMHCRRRFAKAISIQHLKNHTEKEISEVRALLLIDEIYAEEMPLKALPPAKRQEERSLKVRPRVDKFFELIHELHEAGCSYSEGLTDAITYTKRRSSGPFWRMLISPSTTATAREASAISPSEDATGCSAAPWKARRLWQLCTP